MENVAILRFTILRVAVLRHLHEKPLLTVNDANAVNSEGPDTGAGDCLHTAVFIVYDAVDPNLHLITGASGCIRSGSFCVLSIGLCHGYIPPS